MNELNGSPKNLCEALRIDEKIRPVYDAKLFQVTMISFFQHFSLFSKRIPYLKVAGDTIN